MDILQAIAESLKEGQVAKVKELTQAALDEGVSAQTIIDKGLSAGMAVVGDLFREEEIYIPEVLIAAKAMDAGQKVLEPMMLAAGEEKKGKIILGTVKGDIHHLGKQLVGTMLRGSGFEVIDIGEDVPAERFVDVASYENAQIVGMSTLLTTTMPQMRTNIEALRQAGLKQIKILIGGACVTQKYADEIGADGYAENAGIAVFKVKKLLGLE